MDKASKQLVSKNYVEYVRHCWKYRTILSAET